MGFFVLRVAVVGSIVINVNMLDKQKIDVILEPTLAGLGYEYICAEIANYGAKENGGGILRIYIDKLNPKVFSEDTELNLGVTLDDCKLVSKHISRVLNVETGIASKYRLEVSSPGAERPLVRLSHFTRFIGKKVKIRLRIALADSATGAMQRNFIGYLKEVTIDRFVVISCIDKIDSADNLYWFEFINIEKANLVPEWV